MKWTLEEDKDLCDIYPKGTDEEIAARLVNRGWGAIRSRAGILKLKRDIQLTVKKRQDTCLKKYGVVNASTLESIKDKAKNTCLAKYGTISPLQNAEVINKREKTCLERYGVKNVFQCEKIRSISKENSLKKYGVENPMQRKEVKSKRFKKEF